MPTYEFPVPWSLGAFTPFSDMHTTDMTWTTSSMAKIIINGQ